MGEETDDPWPEWADVTHLTGDLYFANRYRNGWWMAAAMCLMFVPPLGAFMLVYMLGRSVVTPCDDLPARLEGENSGSVVRRVWDDLRSA